MSAREAAPQPGQRFGLFTFLGTAEKRGGGGRRLWAIRCDCGQSRNVAPQRLREGLSFCSAPVHRVKDLTGLRFGRLVAKSSDGRNTKREAVWSCVCDCGSECSVSAQQLQSGKTASCGCLKTQNQPSDLSGHRFGRLVALELAGTGDGRPRWRCRCDCGAEKVAAAASLRAGHVVSCGCARRDQPGLMPAAARSERSANCGRRRARQRQAVPPWFGELDEFVWQEAADLAQRREAVTGFAWHADHMAPLAGRKVSGLHVRNNCQVIPASINLEKRNRMILTEPLEWLRHV